MEDDEIVKLLRDRSSRGLVALLEKHGGIVKGVLNKAFARDLDHLERAESFNEAATNAWRWCGSYRRERGTLRSWFCTIAVNAARKTLRKKRRHPTGDVLLATAADAERRDLVPGERQLLVQLNCCIDELPRLQREVVRADLDSMDGTASARDLAESLGTTVNTIYVSRNRARKALRDCLGKKGHGF